MKKTKIKNENDLWNSKGNLSNHKRFMVIIPDESVYIAMVRELSSKHELNPKESFQTLALEYCYNPCARKLIDQVLEKRLDPDEYPKHELVKSTPDPKQIHKPDPKEFELKPWQIRKIDNLRDEFHETTERLKHIDPNQPEHQATIKKAENLLEKRINAIWD